ncbi:hypothetical protein [Nocardioides sp. SR21]|uniref:hypothetical protein n=1 Tax=Nocardioides sp. SR21 TaxID=2919501 RepID=UPI001FA9C8E8|nr:hypothetical protein [Nocardioides sp. SR21]
MNRKDLPWGWIILGLLGLWFLGINLADGDWTMVALAAFVVVFSVVRIIRRRTPPGAAR